MPDEMISKERASTVRLACQSAAVVFVVGAVGVAMLGSPFGGEPSVTEVGFDEVTARAAELNKASGTAPQTEAEPDAPPPDVEAIEYSLQLLKNAPKRPDKPEPVVATTDEKPPEPEAAEGRTRFLGTVRIGDRYLALLTAGGAQRIMGPGDTRALPLMAGDQGDPPRVTVQEVTDQFVRLVENDVERVVDRAERVGIAVSQGAAPTPVDPGQDRGPERAGLNRGVLATPDGETERPINPDDFRRDDGTIDYEALRSAARARARARQDRLRDVSDEKSGAEGEEQQNDR